MSIGGRRELLRLLDAGYSDPVQLANELNISMEQLARLFRASSVAKYLEGRRAVKDALTGVLIPDAADKRARIRPATGRVIGGRVWPSLAEELQAERRIADGLDARTFADLSDEEQEAEVSALRIRQRRTECEGLVEDLWRLADRQVEEVKVEIDTLLAQHGRTRGMVRIDQAPQGERDDP